MADTESPTAAPAIDRAAEQARIRKERREAKIKAGASARLNKITGLGGGVQRDVPPKPTVSPAEDPEEVDISVSEHFYQPNATPRQHMNMNINARAQKMNMNVPMQQGPQMTDEQLRQMMLGFPPSSPPNPNNNGRGGGAPPSPFASFPGMEGMGGPGMASMNIDDDPMMKIMQQLLGGANGTGGGGIPGFSEGLNSNPLFSSSSTSTPATSEPYAYIWRILHALFALSLGLYITFTTTFTGSKLERDQSHIDYSSSSSSSPFSSTNIPFFWIFATTEIALQTSRFFFDQGAIRHSGWLGMIVGLLPEPWKGYVVVLSRYARIWSTLRDDAMMLVFVLGFCAWWRGV